jgi:predicted DNA-binding transcriptional regulator AlpA
MVGLGLLSGAVSLSSPAATDGEATLADTLPAPESERPDSIVLDALTAADARKALAVALDSLIPRHRQAITLRLIDGLTLEEASNRMGVTRERVRQIELKVLPRLREALVDHPAVLALLGREQVAEVDDDDGLLLNAKEVEERTGIDRKNLLDMIGRGTFPRAIAKDRRGHRLWRQSAVERWAEARP